MNQSEQNGQYTSYSSREERYQKEGQESLQCETYQDSGSLARKDRIVYFENASNHRDPFVIQEVATVPELLEKIYDRFPDICLESIQLRVFANRMGVVSRKELFDVLPTERDTLYIYLTLRKHPQLPLFKK